MGDIKVIGELINNSFARARRAWNDRDLAAYQHLARHQVALGASFLTVNIDGTQTVNVRPEEMLAFLPDLVSALQEAVTVPLCFDNPSYKFHEKAFACYNPKISGPGIMNSIAASRPQLDAMLDLIRDCNTRVIVMASERCLPNGGTAQCLNAPDVYAACRQFVELLHERAGRCNDDLIIDPGLAPVGADTYGLVNIGLDAMRMIRQQADLAGLHFSVGLTNFSWGTPKELRETLERAYLTLAAEAGLDYVLANPEKNPQPLAKDHPFVAKLKFALDQGRAQEDETQENAGFRQAEAIMELCI